MSLCMSIGTYEMARWGFDMIERKEYERVCEENRELRRRVAQLENLLGGTNDTGRTKTVNVGSRED